jgi:hypothetical protein
MRESRASIFVVASENKSEAYTALGKGVGRARANVVLTLNRKGANFSTFYARVFEEMWAGELMPMAWVKLAPQIPGFEHADCPSGFMICGAGQVRFASRTGAIREGRL